MFSSARSRKHIYVSSDITGKCASHLKYFVNLLIMILHCFGISSDDFSNFFVVLQLFCDVSHLQSCLLPSAREHSDWNSKKVHKLNLVWKIPSYRKLVITEELFS